MFVFHPLSERTRRMLIDGGLDPDAVASTVRNAVTEDLMGGVDVTSAATIPSDHRSTATFGARQDGVISGLSVVAAVIETVCGEAASEFHAMVPDGSHVGVGTKVAEVTAPTRLLLTAERTALNLLCHLSGVASATRLWADALEGTGAVVRDTRKTMPGLRQAQKYAVRTGGGHNQRLALWHGILIKENHIAAAGGISAVLRNAQAQRARRAVRRHRPGRLDRTAGRPEAACPGTRDRA